MPRVHVPQLFLILLLAVAAPLMLAQGRDRVQGERQTGAEAMDAAQFGERVELGPDWLFRAGDDVAWAAAGLDEAGWQLVSAKKTLAGYGIHDVQRGWYREHVRIRPEAAQHLSIGISTVFGSYEVYVNGVLVGANGGMPGPAFRFQRRLTTYPVPSRLVGASGDLVLALRFAINPTGLAGPGSSTPIADRSAVYLYDGDAAARDESYVLAHLGWTRLVLAALCGLVALIALGLFRALPAQREYLGAGLYLLACWGIYLQDYWIISGDQTPRKYWGLYIFFGLTNVAMIEFIRLVLQKRRTRWLLFLEVMTGVSGFWSVVATYGVDVFYLGFGGYYAAILVANIVMLVLLTQAWRAGNREARFLLPAVALLGVSRYWDFFRYLLLFLHLTTTLGSLPELRLGTYSANLDAVADFVFTIAILYFLVVRTVGIARERARIGAELEAARTTQQLLMAREGQATPGFKVESVYYPASEVGGDFFLVAAIPDGSLMAVVGDVSGKGLMAAMRVAMILGVLRREDSHEPAVVLRNLNEALLNDGGPGFATACCLRVERDGNYTLANAGHISPYVDGVEIAAPPALPLGLAPDQRYDSVAGRLSERETMVLMSDGVVEAQSATGELLGFARLAALSRKDAHGIAGEARAFGQEDDITVLTLTRSEATYA